MAPKARPKVKAKTRTSETAITTRTISKPTQKSQLQEIATRAQRIAEDALKLANSRGGGRPKKK